MFFYGIKFEYEFRELYDNFLLMLILKMLMAAKNGKGSAGVEESGYRIWWSLRKLFVDAPRAMQKGESIFSYQEKTRNASLRSLKSRY